MSKKIFKPFKKLAGGILGTIVGGPVGGIAGMLAQKALSKKKTSDSVSAPLNPLVSPEENKKKATRRNQAARQQVGTQQTILSDTLGG